MSQCLDNIARSLGLGAASAAIWKPKTYTPDYGKSSFTFAFTEREQNSSEIHLRIVATPPINTTYSFSPLVVKGTQYENAETVSISVSNAETVIDLYLLRQGNILTVIAYKDNTETSRYTKTLTELNIEGGKWGRVVWTTDTALLAASGEAVDVAFR